MAHSVVPWGKGESSSTFALIHNHTHPHTYIQLHKPPSYVSAHQLYFVVLLIYTTSCFHFDCCLALRLLATITITLCVCNCCFCWRNISQSSFPLPNTRAFVCETACVNYEPSCQIDKQLGPAGAYTFDLYSIRIRDLQNLPA